MITRKELSKDLITGILSKISQITLLVKVPIFYWQASEASEIHSDVTRRYIGLIAI